MKAIVCPEYGRVELREVPRPVVRGGEALVRVRAASLNPVDLHLVNGTPYVGRIALGFKRPGQATPGIDFAGTVEEVGPGVTGVRPGDEVYGGGRGTLAEFVSVPEGRVAPRPARLTFAQAAAVPVAGLTAFQALRDRARLEAGQSVLVHGAAGGVGTFAVQIARALGGEVTGVCSGAGAELVRSLGARTVIDYTREDWTARGERHDVLLDIAGARPWRELRRALAPRGTCVVIGGSRTNAWFGPGAHFAAMGVASLGARQRVVLFLARARRDDLVALNALLEDGSVTPVIDRELPLADVAAAFRHLATGHAHGKVVLVP